MYLDWRLGENVSKQLFCFCQKHFFIDLILAKWFLLINLQLGNVLQFARGGKIFQKTASPDQQAIMEPQLRPTNYYHIHCTQTSH